ncbi:LPD25 domain-containing protein [Bacillus mycoides]|uniref:LPD25 domain-containing protein n=1 Tax=Bacillus mycoides TaxID=1405 RepID=UPI003D1C56B0
MSKKRSPVSFEEKKQKVEALTKKMEKSIEGYFRSPGDLKEYLSFMAKFYRYSPSNIALIQSQFEGSRAVGSFSFWKEKGFNVKKGEKGIQILVPNRTTAKFKDKKGTWKSVTKANEEEKKQIESKSVEVKPGRLYFAVGHVFDVSQTNVKAEDLPRIFPNRWLEGSVTDYKSLYRGMEAVAEKNGVKIIAPKSELGVAKGVSYTLTKEVALNPRNSELQNVKTLLHELAHAKLHTAETHMNYKAPEKEFQAEMTAYAVSSYFGIDTSEYSLGYLASWTQGKEMKDKTKLLKEVHETSIEFIETIENTLEKEKEKTNEKGVDNMSKQVSDNGKEHVVTVEILDKDIKDGEVAKLHMVDAETKEAYHMAIYDPGVLDRDEFYNGERDVSNIEHIFKGDVYEKVKDTLLDGNESQSFTVREEDMLITLSELEQDDRYAILFNTEKYEATKIKENEKNILLVEYMSLSNTTQELVSVAELREQADRNRAFEPVEGAEKLSDKEFIDAFNEANQEKYAALNQDEINRPTMLVQWSDNENIKNNLLIPFGEANEKMAEVISSIEKAREEARERGETIPYNQARYHIAIPKEVDRDFGRMELVSMDRLDMGDGDYKTPYEQVLNEKRYLSDEVKQALRDEIVNHRNDKEIPMEKAQENTLEKSKETPNHLVTIEVLANGMQDEELARIHMMDGVTKDINYLSVWNQDKTDREDLYVSLMEKNGKRENVYLDNILKPDLYEKVQSSIFDGRGNLSFVIDEKDANMSLDEIVKDERYGLLVDKAEEQKDPTFNEKEVELYKEMKQEGYAPIGSLEQKLNPLPHTATHVTASMEKELSGKYESFKRAQSHETVNDIDSIIHRVQMEERYFATKHVAIDNELITQESVTQLEHKVQEKLNKEGVTATKQTASKVVDREKQFEPFSNFTQFQNVAKKKKQEVELER